MTAGTIGLYRAVVNISGKLTRHKSYRRTVVWRIMQSLEPNVHPSYGPTMEVYLKVMLVFVQAPAVPRASQPLMKQCTVNQNVKPSTI